MSDKNDLSINERISKAIYFICDQKKIINRVLSELYTVETKVLH